MEQFLGDLHEQMEFIKQQHLIFLFEQGYEKRTRRFKRRSKVAKIEGITVKGDVLTFSAAHRIKTNPYLLIQIFEESARLKLPLDMEARRIVREFGDLLDAEMRSQPGVIKSFEKILLAPAPTFNVLNAMLHTGLLERVLPAFKMVINRIQYDEYHIYPVGRHLLRTVMLLKQIKDLNNGTFIREGARGI